jgi:hypothetical protein
MATQSLLAKAGIRLTTLGSAASLAVAAPLAEGSESTAAATDASRIGWYASRTLSSERFGIVVLGTERVAATTAGATVTGVLTVTGAASIGGAVDAGGAITTTSGAITSKPAGTAGIAINPNGAVGDFTISIVPPATLTGNRTLTLLNASGTIVASTGLTDGRVPFSGSGLLTDSSLLTYDATLATGALVVGNTTASTSPTSGAITTLGGLGVGDALHAAGQITAFSGTANPVVLFASGGAGGKLDVGTNNTITGAGAIGPFIFGSGITGVTGAQVLVGYSIISRAGTSATLIGSGINVASASALSGATIIGASPTLGAFDLSDVVLIGAVNIGQNASSAVVIVQVRSS